MIISRQMRAKRPAARGVITSCMWSPLLPSGILCKLPASSQTRMRCPHPQLQILPTARHPFPQAYLLVLQPALDLMAWGSASRRHLAATGGRIRQSQSWQVAARGWSASWMARLPLRPLSGQMPGGCSKLVNLAFQPGVGGEREGLASSVYLKVALHALSSRGGMQINRLAIMYQSGERGLLLCMTVVEMLHDEPSFPATSQARFSVLLQGYSLLRWPSIPSVCGRNLREGRRPPEGSCCSRPHHAGFPSCRGEKWHTLTCNAFWSSLRAYNQCFAVVEFCLALL